MAYLGNSARTKEVLARYNMSAKKKFGQNFLIDGGVLEGIVEAAGVTDKDCVLEIGPGIGTLTQYLAEAAGRVVAVEIDKTLLPVLADTLSEYDNVTVINEDVLKVDIDRIIQEYNEGRPIKVVANLPYYITTPIIMKLLEERLNIESITVMIQKEVAHRLADTPGGKESGSITYTIWYYSEPEILFDVPNSSFIPEPEVTSTVIKFNILEKPRIEVNDEEKFFKVIKASFMQKRKTLVNSLVNGGVISSKEEAEKILTSIGLDTKIRGEKLSLEDFKNLSEKI